MEEDLSSANHFRYLPKTEESTLHMIWYGYVGTAFLLCAVGSVVHRHCRKLHQGCESQQYGDMGNLRHIFSGFFLSPHLIFTAILVSNKPTKLYNIRFLSFAQFYCNRLYLNIKISAYGRLHFWPRSFILWPKMVVGRNNNYFPMMQIHFHWLYLYFNTIPKLKGCKRKYG